MRSLNDIIIEGLADWCTKFTEVDVKKVSNVEGEIYC